MKIAYIGENQGTSLHRAQALERLGHAVTIVDLPDWLRRSAVVHKWLYHTSGFALQTVLRKYLTSKVQAIGADLIWVSQGPYLGKNVIGDLRQHGVPIVNYLNDNPFVRGTPWRRFRSFRRALSQYDLTTACREPTAADLRQAGVQDVTEFIMPADEIAHRPRKLTAEDRKRFSSEVAFIGTWMSERGPLLAALVEKGVPLSIWGDGWHKASEWPVLKPRWRGPGLYDADDYAKSIQCAKICLGLLSEQNQDLYTTRSIEIPVLGGLLCAERTAVHQSLYEDGLEAVFWSDVDECARVCLELLEDEERRRKVARAGQIRAQSNGHFNEQVCSSILDKALP